MATRFIKIKAECILPVPVEVREGLDAVAEAGLDSLRQLIANNITTALPGTIATSWQSMPGSWNPPRPRVKAPAVIERLTPTLSHQVDAEDRVTFVEDMPVAHPWDLGLWIFPEDHPYRAAEAPYRQRYLTGTEPPEVERELKEAVAELEAGVDDAGD